MIATKYRIIEVGPNKFKAQIKRWVFWRTLGHYSTFGDHVDNYYDTQQQAQTAIEDYIKQTCVRKDYPKIRSQGEIIC